MANFHERSIGGRPVTKAVVTGLLVAACLVVATPAHAQEWVQDALEYIFGGGEPLPPKEQYVEPPPGPDLFEAPSSLRLEPLDVVVDEGGVITIRLIRSGGAADVGVGVTVNTIAGTAGLNDDFQGFSQAVTFRPNENVFEIVIQTRDDGDHEGNETFTVVLTNPTHSVLVPRASESQITITDNDAKPEDIKPAQFSPSSEDIDFGGALAEINENVVREVIFANNGGKVGEIGELALYDNNEGVFSILNTDCVARTIAPGAVCSATVLFAPAGAGRFRGNLILFTNAGETKVSLRGRGTLPGFTEDVPGAVVEAARATRRQNSGFVGTLTPASLEVSLPRIYENTAENYGELEIEQNWTTFPVDRTRAITVDRYIPCVLETAINTQIPGFIQCVVESHVYGAVGRLILIPKGTKVIGSISSLDSGQTRANPQWTRFIHPTGASISIGEGFQGLDISGGTGAPVDLHKKTIEKYAPALLTTLLSATITGALGAVAPDDGGFDDTTATIADNLSEITFQLLEEAVNLQDVGTMPAGSRLVIKPIVDLWFKTPFELVPIP